MDREQFNRSMQRIMAGDYLPYDDAVRFERDVAALLDVAAAAQVAQDYLTMTPGHFDEVYGTMEPWGRKLKAVGGLYKALAALTGTAGQEEQQ